MIGKLQNQAQFTGQAHFGNQKTAGAVNRGVGVRQVRQVYDRDAQHLKCGVFIINSLLLLVVSDAHRPHLPGGGAAGMIVTNDARGENGVIKDGFIAADPLAVAGRQARTVREHKP